MLRANPFCDHLGSRPIKLGYTHLKFSYCSVLPLEQGVWYGSFTPFSVPMVSRLRGWVGRWKAGCTCVRVGPGPGGGGGMTSWGPVGGIGGCCKVCVQKGVRCL